jgi:hypothetical protein
MVGAIDWRTLVRAVEVRRRDYWHASKQPDEPEGSRRHLVFFEYAPLAAIAARAAHWVEERSGLFLRRDDLRLDIVRQNGQREQEERSNGEKPQYSC